jgi:UDP-N-acetylmuramoyl-tripeptide--D-alanyl-D-alanine ligase
MTVREVAALIGAETPCDAQLLDTLVTGASIDSRTIAPGELFVPLKGERVDGHAFLDDVLARGHAALCARAVVEARPELRARAGVLVVDEPLGALTALARAVRARWRGPLVGVTGSNGKTTTKEFIAAALGVNYHVLKTAGNLNNAIGVPLTLARLNEAYTAAVVEMGMNHPGEIRELASLARPTVAVITSIGLAHLEGVRDTAGVIAAKMEIAESLRAGETLIVDGDNAALVAAARAFAHLRLVRVGFGADVDLRAVSVESTGAGATATLDGGSYLTLALPGAHNVRNALCALAAAEACGVERALALAAMRETRPPGGRSRVIAAGTLTVIDDSYNANPTSVEAAIEVLRIFPAQGRRIAVLGEMRELGLDAAELHAAVGRCAARAGIDTLVAVGTHARITVEAARDEGLRDTIVAEDAEQALAALLQRIGPHDVVLVKGSRLARMEAVADGLARAMEARRASETPNASGAAASTGREDVDRGATQGAGR